MLVGPAASGKSTWAAEWFPAHQVVSSDALRALVGDGEHDIGASKDAFALLDTVVQQRLRRRITTVVDTLALDPAQRARYRALAEAAGVPCFAVAFDVPPAEIRARNRARGTTVPTAVVSAQLKGWPAVRDALAAEGFAAVHPPGPVTVVPAGAGRRHAARRASGRRCASACSSPASRGRAARPRSPAASAEIAAAAEEAGFDSLWVMDHFRQIPGMGQAWEDMLESWTTLGFLAAATERVRLGTMVTGITYRNVAHLGKIAATLDVLSGGRAVCGLGLGWFEQEHTAYGWEFPPRAERYALLEDALQLLPAAVGQGDARVPRAGARGAGGDVLPPPAAGAHPDPGRRLRRAPHAPPRRPLRRRLQPLRRGARRPPQGRGAPPPLRGGRPGPGRRSRSRSCRPCWWATTAPGSSRRSSGCGPTG